jgi:5-methylcytosine-specific restriction endonuclease McrA
MPMNIQDVYNDCPEGEPRVRSTLPSKGAAIRKLRSSLEYQNVRKQYRSRAKAHHNPDGTKGEPCWICGQPVDYRLKWPHPRSWSLDHVIPVSDNPALLLNPSNFRSAHCDCNNHRQTGEPPIELGEPSEIW